MSSTWELEFTMKSAEKYDEICSRVERTITRSGRWIDFRHDYKTLDLKFMVSLV